MLFATSWLRADHVNWRVGGTGWHRESTGWYNNLLSHRAFQVFETRQKTSDWGNVMIVKVHVPPSSKYITVGWIYKPTDWLLPRQCCSNIDLRRIQGHKQLSIGSDSGVGLTSWANWQPSKRFLRFPLPQPPFFPHTLSTTNGHFENITVGTHFNGLIQRELLCSWEWIGLGAVTNCECWKLKHILSLSIWLVTLFFDRLHPAFLLSHL